MMLRYPIHGSLQRELDVCKDWQRKAMEQLSRFGVQPYVEATTKASEMCW